MTKMVVSFANGLASRTSRRSFLGRTGKLAVGLVGGSALFALMTETAQATGCPGCSNPCFHWNTCDCWGNPWKIRNHYDCPSCSRVDCQFSVCTGVLC